MRKLQQQNMHPWGKYRFSKNKMTRICQYFFLKILKIRNLIKLGAFSEEKICIHGKNTIFSKINNTYKLIFL
jgi:hypothetical protein